MSDESSRTVAVALAANLGIAAAKLVAAILTGSTAMSAEAAHAFAIVGTRCCFSSRSAGALVLPTTSIPLGMFAEDAAAIAGDVIAFLGVGLHQVIDTGCAREPVLLPPPEQVFEVGSRVEI